MHHRDFFEASFGLTQECGVMKLILFSVLLSYPVVTSANDFTQTAIVQLCDPWVWVHNLEGFHRSTGTSITTE
jgi:hypothetical protein